MYLSCVLGSLGFLSIYQEFQVARDSHIQKLHSYSLHRCFKQPPFDTWVFLGIYCLTPRISCGKPWTPIRRSQPQMVRWSVWGAPCLEGCCAQRSFYRFLLGISSLRTILLFNPLISVFFFCGGYWIKVPNVWQHLQWFSEKNAGFFLKNRTEQIPYALFLPQFFQPSGWAFELIRAWYVWWDRWTSETLWKCHETPWRWAEFYFERQLLLLMEEILQIIGYCIYQINWCRISSINSMK